MRRIRALNGVAAGILSSFVSRNNDSDGYWALGKLRALAAQLGWVTVEVCLQPIAANEQAPLVCELARRYQTMLERLLSAAPLDARDVRAAKIVIRFEVGLQELSVARFLPTTWGTPFSCEVLITDARGKAYSRKLYGCCSPHDPSRESRSTRAGAV
jgi:hypothetical protein